MKYVALIVGMCIANYGWQYFNEAIENEAWQEALIRLETNQEPPEVDHETEHQEMNK